MYLLFFILILLFLLFFFLDRRRKRKIVCKVRDMCMKEKCRLIDELLEPFGYCYLPSQDIFASRQDAWQREMGYCRLYDLAAPRLHLVFDSLPVYFDYRNRTWLLEFWKGQYGVNTGGEIGLYQADRLLTEQERGSTLFTAVPDESMLRMSFTLFRQGTPIAHRNENNCCQCKDPCWWLTAFRLGEFTDPADLTLFASVDFPNADMARAFTKGLKRAGFDPCDICCRCSTVSFSFDRARQSDSFRRRALIRWAQFSNRFWCRAYLSVTGPFVMSVDRVLYLYFYLPFAFRRMLRIRRFRKKDVRAQSPSCCSETRSRHRNCRKTSHHN